MLSGFYEGQFEKSSILSYKYGKVFKNGPSKICGRQPSKNFTWSILEYFVPNDYINLLMHNVPKWSDTL